MWINRFQAAIRKSRSPCLFGQVANPPHIWFLRILHNFSNNRIGFIACLFNMPLK
ncbi:hypothetical protein THIOM_000674 [Candidatus Thiomargarita nelsonii]|uniref:Uncharacterized protein n=1 Tax=Candidatus Thiomargarita nelsonii TaxID=1003181 RepID=A0A176S6H2_9GAMM|nr:hypothetical protein THIOM_000674 [Candidatus Thiomargarita nelsonii]